MDTAPAVTADLHHPDPAGPPPTGPPTPTGQPGQTGQTGQPGQTDTTGPGAGRAGTSRTALLWRLAGVTAAWGLAVGAGSALHQSSTVHRAALFAHLCSLVLGLGAVLMVDWFGLLWLLRRRTLADVLRVIHGAAVPTWLGLLGLLVSGALLEPDLTALTAIKLGAVLLVALNGVYAWTLSQRLAGLAAGRIGWALMLRSAGCATLSQAAWWTATAIGFLNAQS